MNTTLLHRDGLERISDRLRLYRASQPGAVASFAEDVLCGLSDPRKHLLPKYLYDALGSALFEAITELPEYYLTRSESAILARDAGEMLDAIGHPVEIVELGSGSAQKTRLVIEQALCRQQRLTYHPIDISESALLASAGALIHAYDRLDVTAYASDYFDVLSNAVLRTSPDMRVLALFLGSNVGNYAPPHARALLRALAAALRSDDYLLLGADLKKDVAVLEAAYDDPTGVTAAFNKNLLGRINRELGGTFDLRDFIHKAHYVSATGSVDSYLVATRTHTVRVGAIDFDVSFERDEDIHTESSHKLSPDEISELALATGFRLVRMWTDSETRFSVSLLTVV
jgi:L-histidine N-alpha-methyltransferase